VSPLGATILRIMLGAIYIAHAYYVYFDVTPDSMATLINTKVGLPVGDSLVLYVIIAHLLGGIMMVLGLFTRWAAFVNIPVMLGAVLFIHLGDGFFLRAVVIDAARGKPVVVGYEYALLVLVATIAQFFLGGGTFAMTKDA
jgi:putative oxidoreductase